MLPVVAVVMSFRSRPDMLMSVVRGMMVAAVDEPMREAVPSREEALQEPVAKEESDDVSDPAWREEEQKEEKDADIHDSPRSQERHDPLRWMAR